MFILLQVIIHIRAEQVVHSCVIHVECARCVRVRTARVLIQVKIPRLRYFNFALAIHDRCRLNPTPCLRQLLYFFDCIVYRQIPLQLVNRLASADHDLRHRLVLAFEARLRSVVALVHRIVDTIMIVAHTYHIVTLIQSLISESLGNLHTVIVLQLHAIDL